MATKSLPFSGVSTTQVSLWLIIHELIALLLLISLLVITLTAVMIAWVVIAPTVPTVLGDHAVHLNYAIQISKSGVVPIPHFLYQSLVIGVHSIVRDDNWLLSAVLANLIPQIGAGIIIYLALRACLRDSEKTWQPAQKWIIRYVCAALALGVLIAVPIFSLLTTVSGGPSPIMLGFITPITYHSPTLILLRPFAVVLYLLISAYVLPASNLHLKRGTTVFLVGLMIASTVLCGLSKPNYLLALLPALCIWLVWSIWRKQSVSWQFILIGVLLPAVVILAWQYVFTFVNPTKELGANSGIIFAPFKVVLGISGDSLRTVVMRFGVSLLFPAAVYLFWWKSATRDRALNFAWLVFIIGAFFMYFLSESGSRWLHGNFFWTAYITIFVLNFASVRFAFQKWLELQQSGQFHVDWRIICIVVLFSLHVMSGIYFIDWTNHWLYAMA